MLDIVVRDEIPHPVSMASLHDSAIHFLAEALVGFELRVIARKERLVIHRDHWGSCIPAVFSRLSQLGDVSRCGRAPYTLS